jgi:N-acetylglucosaminyldiphosphoundecaprenol N-acetyl-beta-D-mannosaminyltransferase
MMLAIETELKEQLEDVGTEHILRVPIVGLPVHMIQIPEVVSLMTDWACVDRGRGHWIVVADMHAVVEAHRNVEFRRMLHHADLIVPDGIGLVRVAQLKGAPLRTRVTGTDLMKAFFSHTRDMGLSHYFMGDTEDTLSHLEKNLRRNYAGLEIAGTCSPPFRALTPAENDILIDRINDANADVLWVGLGLPKQERWIFEHRHRLNVPLVLGVGAAFKFLAGTVRRAPDWMGNMGFEWLWRFAQEPKRLWRRILLEAPQFVGLVTLDLSGWRKFS